MAASGTARGGRGGGGGKGRGRGGRGRGERGGTKFRDQGEKDEWIDHGRRNFKDTNPKCRLYWSFCLG
jgi:hypothetical protein